MKDFNGFTAHTRFVREHHEKVARVAVVTDSHLAGILDSLGKHFVATDVRRFPYKDKAEALNWLKAVQDTGLAVK